ncbi:MAG: nuclear transport factor 2 family protein, partial [Acidobacteria bacterium]|nr:nuclear transport factor 2 family protein [Acidobacteriota bacterium]
MGLYIRKAFGFGLVKRITVLLWFVLFLVPCFSFAQQLDEQTVLKMVSEMDHAISQRDASGLARFLSAEITVIANIRASGQAQKLTMNKSSYIESLKQGWAVATGYEYKRTDLKITLSGPAKAVVTATISESATVQGQTIRSTSTETAVIELVGGKPMITSVVAN